MSTTTPKSARAVKSCIAFTSKLVVFHDSSHPFVLNRCSQACIYRLAYDPETDSIYELALITEEKTLEVLDSAFVDQELALSEFGFDASAFSPL